MEKGKTAAKSTKKSIFQKILRRLNPGAPEKKKALLADEAAMPYIPANHISMVIAEARWKTS